MTQYSEDILFVSYCSGPHCDCATKATKQLARLGRPVKIMIGGVTDWIDEGFDLVSRNSLKA